MTTRKLKGKYFVIWPQYLDSTLSRRLGRRVPKELSVPHPTQKELIEIAKSLGRDVIPLEKLYPREWWYSEGGVAIEKLENETKTQLLLKVAQELVKRRYSKLSGRQRGLTS
ncbi:signal recognition particle [Ignicoccus pacificus DSM 13166]|uniref:Signal recognition particle 19 kDa protein n=1 Tax=Ignicoccus pacificus DSM 13166 TaxID=940294 RepID=A0A977PKN8_9CREN|nr:signal recognition particle [Ignicoccus pacificus DSM 13166]